MQLDDILYACNCITGISAIPARVYQNNTLKHSFGLANMPVDPVTPYEKYLLPNNEHISYFCTPFYQFFGSIQHNEFTIIFGPVGQAEYIPQEKRDYAFALGITPIEFDQLLSAMRQIPAFTLENFLHFLLLLNFYFNGERKEITEIACKQIDEDNIMIPSSQEETPSLTNHELPFSYTYSFEKEMLNYVREGDVEGLKKFFSSHIHGNVGKLSYNQIRQQKNLFIVATTLISRAAIEGGMYEDQAYQLSDMYIRRCEELFSIEYIMKLNYIMALDFTEHVFSIGKDTSMSPLVASVINYIRRNISADLSCKTLSDRFLSIEISLVQDLKKKPEKHLMNLLFMKEFSGLKAFFSTQTGHCLKLPFTWAFRLKAIFKLFSNVLQDKLLLNSESNQKLNKKLYSILTFCINFFNAFSYVPAKNLRFSTSPFHFALQLLSISYLFNQS